MMNITNSDSFGNHYLNGFSKNISPVVYHSYDEDDAGAYDFDSFFTSVYGGSRYWTTGTISSKYRYFLFDSPQEGNTVPNGVLARFQCRAYAGTYDEGVAINKVYQGTNNFVNPGTYWYTSKNYKHPLCNEGGITNPGTANYKTFITCSPTNVSAFRCKHDMTQDPNPFDGTGFISFGWLNDPIPSVSNYFDARMATAYALFVNCHIDDRADGNEAYRVENEDATGSLVFASTTGAANYSVTCQSGGPPTSPWTTNLVLIDETSAPENYGLGSVPNLLLAKGTYTFGQVYKVANVGNGEANTNPNTEQPFFVCVGQWGTDYVLMRVYTEGYV